MSLKTLRYFIGLVAYPKGSIYCTYSNLTADDISSIWGGTWEEIKGRFLYGGGDNDTLGDIGGSAHTVLPAHTHTLAHNHTLLAGSTPATGGAHTHAFNRSVAAKSGTAGPNVINYHGSGYTADWATENTGAHTHTVVSGTANTSTTEIVEPIDIPYTFLPTVVWGQDGENYGNLPPFSLVKMFVRISI